MASNSIETLSKQTKSRNRLVSITKENAYRHRTQAKYRRLAHLPPIDPLALHRLGPLTHPRGLGPVHVAVEGHHGAVLRGVVIVPLE